MKHLDLKNRKKFYRRIQSDDGSEKDIEICFTLLYNNQLYCAYRYLDEDAPPDVLEAMHFSLRRWELCVEPFAPEAKEPLIKIMSTIIEAGEYEPAQHFVWLEDTHSIVLEDRILRNNQENFLLHLWDELKVSGTAVISVWNAAYNLLLLSLSAVMFSYCVNLWEELLQYRYFFFDGIGISASMVRLLLTGGYLLLSALIWRLFIGGGSFGLVSSFALGMVVFAVTSMCVLEGNLSALASMYADPMEYAYSTLQNYENSAYYGMDLEIKENSVVIPALQPEDKIGEETVYGACLERDTLRGRDVMYYGAYDKETSEVKIDIPELASDFQYGVLTVWSAGDSSAQAMIAYGERPEQWYQRLLNTSLDFSELNEKDTFANAVKEGEVGAPGWVILLWNIWLSLGSYMDWKLLLATGGIMWILLNIWGAYEGVMEFGIRGREEWIVCSIDPVEDEDELIQLSGEEGEEKD